MAAHINFRSHVMQFIFYVLFQGGQRNAANVINLLLDNFYLQLLC